MKFWYVGLGFWLIRLTGNPFGGLVAACDEHTAEEIKAATGARTVLPLTAEAAAALCGRGTAELAEAQGRSICPVCRN